MLNNSAPGSCGVSSMPSPCIAAIALATAAVSDFGSSQGARTSLEYQFHSCVFLQRQYCFQRRLQINMLRGAASPKVLCRAEVPSPTNGTSSHFNLIVRRRQENTAICELYLVLSSCSWVLPLSPDCFSFYQAGLS